MEHLWSDPDISAHFAHLKAATGYISEALQDLHRYLRRPLDGSYLELEMRLGVVGEDGFQSDVGKECFYTILHQLESFAGWVSVCDWTETQDVFYTIPLPPSVESRDFRRADIRTSVGLGEDRVVSLKHAIKRRLKVLDFHAMALSYYCQDELGPQESPPASPSYSLRFSMSVETPVPPELLPSVVTPTLVRIKQRKRFLLASLGVDKPAFAFDLTIVYTGESKSAAERMQAEKRGARHEVEIECLEPLLYLQSCDFQESMLALSLLLKAYDLLALLTKGQATQGALALKISA